MLWVSEYRRQSNFTDNQEARSAKNRGNAMRQMQVTSQCPKASCGASGNDSLPEMPCERTYENWNMGKIPRVAINIPNRVNRLKAIGNGHVPAVVRAAWEILSSQPVHTVSKGESTKERRK